MPYGGGSAESASSNACRHSLSVRSNGAAWQSPLFALAAVIRRVGSAFRGLKPCHHFVESPFPRVESAFRCVEWRFPSVLLEFPHVEPTFPCVLLKFPRVESRFQGVELEFPSVLLKILHVFPQFSGVELRFLGVERCSQRFQAELTGVESARCGFAFLRSCFIHFQFAFRDLRQGPILA